MRLSFRLIAAVLILFAAESATRAWAAPSFSIADARCQVGMHCVFTITKTGKATSYSDVVYSSTGAAATPTTVKIRFLRGDTAKTATQQGIAAGTFTATIRIARYGVIGRGTAVGTVTAPTPPPTAPILTVESMSVAENAGTAVVHVARAGVLTQASSASYTTKDATAIAGINYQGRSGTLTFGLGQADAALSVPILADGKVQGPLIFNVILSGLTNAQLGANGSVTVTNTDVEQAPTQTCPDGTVIPATDVCPVSPPLPPAGMVRAVQACASINGNGQSLIVGNTYSVVGFAGWALPEGPKPPPGTKDIFILNDATHLGDGVFGLWVAPSCISTQP